MATTSNGLTLLEVGQKEKEVTINTNFTALDGSSTVTTTNNVATALPLTAEFLGFSFANDSTYDFDATIVARNTATDTENKSFKVDFLFRRGAAAANSSLVGSPTVTARFADTGTTGWTVTVTTDATNGRPQISVTGENSKSIKWVMKAQIAKVTG